MCVKFLINFGQGVLHFHFELGPTSCVADPWLSAM